MAERNSSLKITDGDQLNEGFFNGIGRVVTIEAGENLTSGNVVCILSSDGKAYLSDITSATKAFANGIALETKNTGQDIAVLLGGVYVTAGLTDKECYYLSTAGTYSTTATSVTIGVALSTTELLLDITNGVNYGYANICVFMPDATVGTWAATVNVADIMNGNIQNTSTAQNDSASYEVPLDAGTYTIKIMYSGGNNCGEAHVLIDSVDVGNVDTYSVGATVNQIASLTGIVVIWGGIKTITIKVSDKNAGSSDYVLAIQALVFYRTA